MRILTFLILVLVIISCNRNLLQSETISKNQPHEVHIRFINQFDLEIKRVNNSHEVQYYLNDPMGPNKWKVFNKDNSQVFTTTYRPDMDYHKLKPLEVNIDTIDFYYWIRYTKLEDGKYSLQYTDGRNNVISNIAKFDFSRIKYNRPNSSFKNFLNVTLDSIDFDIYRINIYNPTIYNIDMDDLNVYLSAVGQIIDGYVTTEYYTIDDKKLMIEPREPKLKSKKSISIKYTINREDIITLQNNAGHDSGVLQLGLSSKKYLLSYELKWFGPSELTKIKNNGK